MITSSASGPSTSSTRQCSICPRPAYCTNYGVVSCDACKMFFRRVVVLKKDYKCRLKNECWPMMRHCKACRFRRCLDAGMTYIPSFLELRNKKDDDVVGLVRHLIFLDSRRSENMKNYFTDADFSLKELLERTSMELKPRKTDLTPHDWSFLGIYTSIEFLLGVDFMKLLEPNDQIILLKNFCVKASLFASAMRAVKEKRDRLMTVDGRDVYPDGLKKLSKFSDAFLDRIRSLLVARLIDLRVTNEEFTLLTVIFFAHPFMLSKHGCSIVSTYQKTYSSALLKYCSHTYQQAAPSRFVDLLSLCHVINRNFEDVQYMTMIFRFYNQGMQYRKIVNEVI